MNNLSKLLGAAGLCITLGLAGCGGGGSGSDDAATNAGGSARGGTGGGTGVGASPSSSSGATLSSNGAVSDNVGVSVKAFMSYLLVMGASDETSEPATIKETFTVPSDEANEPRSMS